MLTSYKQSSVKYIKQGSFEHVKMLDNNKIDELYDDFVKFGNPYLFDSIQEKDYNPNILYFYLHSLQGIEKAALEIKFNCIFGFQYFVEMVMSSGYIWATKEIAFDVVNGMHEDFFGVPRFKDYSCYKSTLSRQKKTSKVGTDMQTEKPKFGECAELICPFHKNECPVYTSKPLLGA